ncbi:PREDICTED: uncharacterized protein LOC109473285 [Branchiostoma belcheri]|uniref:Uncharacterized protein LOC109473285 n=1 Tax=Branchiostoma belcheri TaxID=7741 RepID=A0A6P4YHE6_BRABE|nr:PREDICTED: uncharacterized protein LOC109473285 [Branchiostoma belcheri]
MAKRECSYNEDICDFSDSSDSCDSSKKQKTGAKIIGSMKVKGDAGRNVTRDLYQTQTPYLYDASCDTVDVVIGRLKQCLRSLAQYYTGYEQNRIRYLAVKNPLKAYELMTIYSQNLANVTKLNLFVEPHKYFISRRPLMKKWMEEMNKKFAWWAMSDQKEIDTYMKNAIKLVEVFKSENADGVHHKPSWGMSTRPMEMGMYIDKALGDDIMRMAVMGLYGITPGQMEERRVGRLPAVGFPMVAATPDGITCQDSKKCEQYMDYVQSLGGAPALGISDKIDDLIRRGVPRVSHELKSIQVEEHKEHSGSRVFHKEMQRMKYMYKNGSIDSLREYCLQLLVSKLENGKWVPSTQDRADDLQYKKERHINKLVIQGTKYKKVKNSNQMKRILGTPSFFKANFHLYPTDDLDKLQVDTAGHLTYQHLLGENEIIDLKTIRSWPKQAVITVYENMKVVFQVKFDRAPLLLSPRGKHYKQMLVQAMCMREYNGGIRYVYHAILSHSRAEANKKLEVAMVYSYDTGIDDQQIDMALKQTIAAMGTVDSWFDDFVKAEKLESVREEHRFYRKCPVNIPVGTVFPPANKEYGSPSDSESDNDDAECLEDELLEEAFALYEKERDGNGSCNEKEKFGLEG